jgi:aspartyl/asparaginyl-tRNA synthetase
MITTIAIHLMSLFEEIISGGQHIHDAELLNKQVIECRIDVNTLSSYIDSSGGGQCHMEELE